MERELSIACQDFAAEIGDSPWQIAWCAGAGVVASGSTELAQETRAFGRLLKSVTEELCGRGKSPGAMFLASSAGGVYAGNKAPPFCEDSPVAPISPYGWAKLEQESLARQWSMETGTPLLVGRLSNLYGPGQKLSKGTGSDHPDVPSGRVTSGLGSLCPSRHDPGLSVRQRRRSVGRRRTGPPASRSVSKSPLIPTVVKILASQQPTTVSTLLAQLRSITKRPLSVITATSPVTWRQPRDLRMTSSVWPELDRRPMTSLSEGIRCVLTEILDSSARGQISNRFA